MVADPVGRESDNGLNLTTVVGERSRDERGSGRAQDPGDTRNLFSGSPEAQIVYAQRRPPIHAIVQAHYLSPPIATRPLVTMLTRLPGGLQDISFVAEYDFSHAFRDPNATLVNGCGGSFSRLGAPPPAQWAMGRALRSVVLSLRQIVIYGHLAHRKHPRHKYQVICKPVLSPQRRQRVCPSVHAVAPARSQRSLSKTLVT